jgi:hypothetical protein
LLDRTDFAHGIDEVMADPDTSFREWREIEAKHRLAHGWITLDQEISLFADETPLISMDKLNTPMPESDAMWHAGTTREWLDLFRASRGDPSYSPPKSLRDFYTSFVNGELNGQTLSPLKLRLLLHPLQVQVCHARQFLTGAQNASMSAWRLRLQEIQPLLQQWYGIIKLSFNGQKGDCWTTCANLIMYHLISLNILSSFTEIERFARRQVDLGSYRESTWLKNHCVDSAPEIYFHCGQVLRLVTSMPKPVRPAWWSGAVYRVAMTGWAASMALGGKSSTSAPPAEAAQPFAINGVTPEHVCVQRYLTYQEGTPMLRTGSGPLTPLDVPTNIVEYVVDILDDDPSMRMSEGIKHKLKLFVDSWKKT